MKKKRQNAKRSRKSKPSPPQQSKPTTQSEEATKAPEAAREEFDEDMVEHLRVQTSLLEEREVSREEILELLGRLMRQHSIAPESRRDYVMRTLKEREENPP